MSWTARKSCILTTTTSRASSTSKLGTVELEKLEELWRWERVLKGNAQSDWNCHNSGLTLFISMAFIAGKRIDN